MSRLPLSRRWLAGGTIVVGLGLGLLLPEAEPPLLALGRGRPFVWDQRAMWKELERQFLAARQGGCPADLAAREAALQRRLLGIEAAVPAPDAAVWDELELALFELAAVAAACPAAVAPLLRQRGALRITAKRAARSWPVGSAARARLYRLLYGSRAAVEEALLQSAEPPPGLTVAERLPSASPAAEVSGVQVHSGDLLLSRGAAPTSALIARGNDYPGNFSHVALVHVGELDSRVSVIESLIESGVVVNDADAYLGDGKLRIMLLRLRADLPQLAGEPRLAHRAATAAFTEAQAGHIPYDFAMDVGDPAARFCSEVASAAYRQVGVELWPQLSTFSSPGLGRWLAAFGVRHLETHSPSDLEYDPALTVIAEWHDREALFTDHLDSAVIDVMLERAEAGRDLDYDRALLPIARLLKGVSLLANLVGRSGPIPEGMSATVALRAEWLRAEHGRRVARTRTLAEEFHRAHGFLPPYWQLVDLARQAEAGG